MRDHGSPATPLTDNSVPNRPTTGTPAPWAPRLSVLARYSSSLALRVQLLRVTLVNVIKPVFDLFLLPRASQNEKGDEIKPVYVGEFPQVVRDEQASMLHRHVHGG